MFTLSPSQLLTIWEQGISQSSIQRAMIILSIAMPNTVTPQNLAELTLGNRNIYLFNIRENLFGNKIDCFTRCNHCKTSLEFTFDSTLLKSETPPLPEEISCTIADKKYKLRLINCQDLMISAQQPNVEQAERTLIERCIAEITDNGHLVETPQFSTDILETLAAELQSHDPLAELCIQCICPNCTKIFQIMLDIADFLWHEIAMRAKQLLAEVHQLARAYGWREADILELNHSRREYYLSQVN